MFRLTTMLAQAGDSGSGGDGAAVIGWIIIFLVCCGIYNACNKKKEFDVRLGGTIKER